MTVSSLKDVDSGTSHQLLAVLIVLIAEAPPVVMKVYSSTKDPQVEGGLHRSECMCLVLALAFHSDCAERDGFAGEFTRCCRGYDVLLVL